VIADGKIVAMAEAVGDLLGLRVFAALDDALATKPDAAFICTPSALHVPAAIACARAGAHLFMEKPLSHTLDGVRELLAEVARASVIGTVGCQMRFHPCLVRAAAAIRNETLGRVLAVRAAAGEHLPDWHPYEDYRTGYAARRSLGGGVILTLIHELDYVQWMFGVPKRVFALGGQWSRLELDEVEDVASMLLECADARGRPVAVHVQLDYLQRPPRRSCEIVGDKGTFNADLRGNSYSLRLHDDSSDRPSAFPEFERNDMFLDEIRHFVGAMRGEHPPAVSLAEAADTLRVVLAAKESMITHRAVEIA
ncbi:MAG: Gfo/Idh/MocA family oxidoreductase, partial [Gemmatimonadaceae bacterium]